MASTYLSRTSGTPTSQKIGTFSLWIKRSELVGAGNEQWFSSSNSSTTDINNRWNIKFTSSEQIELFNVSSSSTNMRLQTNRVFRDINAWYHIVIAVDTTQATASDRLKMWVNGVQETSFAASTYPSLDDTSCQFFQSGKIHRIGAFDGSGTYPYYLSGLIAHYHYTDGTAYDASAFGETDATSGVWKPKTAPSVTYGTNGFFLKFANAASLGTDSSGNGNNFTVNGSGTQTLDTPSNVYCTMNPLDNYIATGTFSEGNNTITTVNTGYPYNTATMGVNKGKWYWECKWSAQPTGTSNQVLVGIAKRVCPNTTTWLGSAAYTYAYQGTGTVHNSDTTLATYTAWSIGDIIGVALDMDNNRIYFSRNGTWQGSSDPANGTNPISISAPDSTTADSGFYFPAFGDGNNSLQETGQFNFGNGTFGTTAISSPNNDGAGEGKFAYAPPTGYYALNTKNLKTYG